MNHYINKIQNKERPVLDSVYPTESEQMEEEMFLGLRMNQGVSRKRFEQNLIKQLMMFITTQSKI